MKHTHTFLLIGIFLYCAACGQKNSTPEPVNNSGPPALISDSLVQELKKQKEDLAKRMSSAQITYYIIKAPEEKFGYTIFIDGQMYIEQKSIPALEGTHGFDTKEDAEKIAKLVIEKIKQGEMPPAISVDELKAHGIVRNP